MIKFLILLCFVSSFALDCSESKEVQYLDHNTSNTDSISYIRFFENFPNRFELVVERYTRSSEDPLYVDYTRDLPYLFENKKYIDKALFYQKMVNIGIDGKWAPDAVNRLQILIRKECYENCLAITKFIGSNYDNDQLNSSFFFFFDEIHPDIAWENGLPDCFTHEDSPL